MANAEDLQRCPNEIIFYLQKHLKTLEGALDHGRNSNTGDRASNHTLDDAIAAVMLHAASVLRDAHGSLILKRIPSIFSALQMRTFLGCYRGSLVRLAVEKTSSKVLLEFLGFAGQFIQEEAAEPHAALLSMGEGTLCAARGGEEVGYLKDIIISLVSEMSGSWMMLLGHIHGRQVACAFLRVLSGLPVNGHIDQKLSCGTRGPDSLSMYRNSTPNSSLATLTGEPFDLDSEARRKWKMPGKYVVPTCFQSSLRAATGEISALSTPKLRAHFNDPFWGPSILLLMHANAALTTGQALGYIPHLEEESPAMRIISKAWRWKNQARSCALLGTILKNREADRFVEAVWYLSSDRFFLEFYEKCFVTSILEPVQHGIPNALMQAPLRRVEDKALAERMVETVIQLAYRIEAAGRTSVLTTAAHLCVRLNLSPEIQQKFLEAIAQVVPAGITDNDLYERAAHVKDALAKWAWVMLDPHVHEVRNTSILHLNTEGTKLMYNLLQFNVRTIEPLMMTFPAFPSDTLGAMARNAMAVKWILIPLVDATRRVSRCSSDEGTRGDNIKAIPEILSKIKESIVELACDAVARKFLLHCVHLPSMNHKRRILDELAAGGEAAISRMKACASGRRLLDACGINNTSPTPPAKEAIVKRAESPPQKTREEEGMRSKTTKRRRRLFRLADDPELQSKSKKRKPSDTTKKISKRTESNVADAEPTKVTPNKFPWRIPKKVSYLEAAAAAGAGAGAGADGEGSRAARGR